MRLALALILAFIGGCAAPHLDKASADESRRAKASDQTGSSWIEERKALYQHAREGLRLSREQYIATTRPVLQLKFRYDYPSLTETEIDVLVDEALEKGVRQEAARRPEGPVRQPPMDCLSPLWRGPPHTNCY